MSITAANASIMLSIPLLFPAPQRIQGFSADNVFDNEPVSSAETSMGVDGKLSAGFVFVPTNWGITLQADSLSNDFFDQWIAAQKVLRDVYRADGVVSLTTLGKIYTMTKGFLTSYPTMPNAEKVLRPRKYVITWESISPANA